MAFPVTVTLKLTISCSRLYLAPEIAPIPLQDVPDLDFLLPRDKLVVLRAIGQHNLAMPRH